MDGTEARLSGGGTFAPPKQYKGWLPAWFACLHNSTDFLPHIPISYITVKHLTNAQLKKRRSENVIAKT